MESDLHETTPAAVKPMRVSDRAIATPALWAVGCIAFMLLCAPFNQSEGEDLFSRLLQMMLIGAVIGLFVQCAVWAAWAPHALKWRAASATSTASLLAILGSMHHGRLMDVVICLGLFLVFWVVLWGVRCWTGVRLRIEARNSPAERRGFGLGYLLGWTAAIAVLIGLASEVSWRVDFPGQDAFQFLLYLACQLAAFALVMANALTGVVVVLGNRSKLFFGVPVAVVFVAATTAAAAWVFARITANGPATFAELWRVFLCFGAGAAMSAFLFGLAIRYGGYRLATDASA